MIQQKHLDLFIIILMILCGGLVIFEVSQWGAGDNINLPQKNPVSQTRSSEKINEFNLTPENKCSEIYNTVLVHNTTDVAEASP